jgi:hypothetical protein
VDGAPVHHPQVIRNVVLHLLSEQPLLADLFEMPTTADVTFRCTNLRTLEGRRPVFVDRSDSVFLFPYLHVRFVEIPPTSVTADGTGGEPVGAAAADQVDEANELDLEIDEDFLRRVREA